MTDRDERREELRELGRDVATQATSTLIGRFVDWVTKKVRARRARRARERRDE